MKNSVQAYYLRRTFARAISITDQEGGPTLKEFWKGFNILNAVKNIGESWKEIKESNLNGVCKKLCPEFVSDFQGFEDQVDEVTADIVKMAGQLQLEVEKEDVEELLDSHIQELTSEELVHLEEQRKAENQARIQESPAQGTMTTKQMSEAFKHLEAAVAIFEEMDPNL
ncbi:hypothetical protein Y1Q_0019167 [Alligator mississippiensis]|uniref:DDE-1 domain-containing protein n=1 Tax=Alligator mississippiensis TaxID=8496 RepID=A0A151MQ81_ALLMI|nr:hypothetical protein Y1Q_0019167 [Alligator mississippiensis]